MGDVPGVELGTIEGFYGRPWSWEARGEHVAFLAPYGYRFFLYAPKADAFLRRRWREDHPRAEAEALGRLAGRCREVGVRFGVGVSPYEVYAGFDGAAREALGRKLEFLDAVGVRDLAILFDDMRGDVPELAARQAEIVEWAAARTGAERVLVCPSYYSDDPVLDRVFGARPEGYLEALGGRLDASIEILWTGEEVVPREISPAHLRRVAERMGRRPFLWDNYPVNDGQRMSPFLHVRGFTGRLARIAGLVSAHGVNPALQPVLSRIPMLTLVESYRLGEEGYAYGEAFRRAAEEVLGAELGRRLWEDALLLQDVGRDRLGERAAELRWRWAGAEHPAAREVVGWLDGEYAITDEVVRTQ